MNYHSSFAANARVCEAKRGSPRLTCLREVTRFTILLSPALYKNNFSPLFWNATWQRAPLIAAGKVITHFYI